MKIKWDYKFKESCSQLHGLLEEKDRFTCHSLHNLIRGDCDKYVREPKKDELYHDEM